MILFKRHCTMHYSTVYLLLALSSLVWSTPLLNNQFGAALDLQTHYQWAAQFERTLHEGIWVPRWNAASNQGLGDATFLHIHPMYYYLVATFNVVFNDIWVAMRFIVITANLALGLIVFDMAKKMFGSRQALASAITAQWAPIAFIQMAFMQSFPTLLAMPLAVLTIGWTFVECPFKKYHILACSLALSGTILAPILVGFMVISSVSLAFIGLLAFSMVT